MLKYVLRLIEYYVRTKQLLEEKGIELENIGNESE